MNPKLLPLSGWLEAVKEGFVPPHIDPSTPLPQVVMLMTEALSKHFRESQAIFDYLEYLPKARPTIRPEADGAQVVEHILTGTGHRFSCPDAPTSELVEYLITRKGQVPKDDPEMNYRFMRDIVSPVAQFVRGVMMEAMLKVSDLSHDDEIVILLFPDLGSAVEELYLAVFQKMMVPYQKLKGAEKEAYREIVSKAVPGNWDYTCFDFVGGEVVNRVSWAVAFPEETSVICHLLHVMEEKFEDGAMKNYVFALRRAYACTNIDKLEENWAAVDEAWLNFPDGENLACLTHGFEAYDHFKVVSPECRLDIVVPTDQKKLRLLQEAILAEALALGMQPALEANIRDKYAKLSMNLYANVNCAGWGLNFGYGGQAGPNREELQAHGVRVFVECAGTAGAINLALKLLKLHADPETYDLVAPLITPDAFFDFIWGHELAHFVAKTAALYEAVGMEAMDLMEEAKASLLGTLANARLHSYDPQYLLNLAAFWTTRIVRFYQTSEQTNPTVQPYIRETMATFGIVDEAELLTLTDRGIHLNPDLAMKGDWLNGARDLVGRIIKTYNDHDKDGLEDMAKRKCLANQAYLNWVNRPNPVSPSA